MSKVSEAWEKVAGFFVDAFGDMPGDSSAGPENKTREPETLGAGFKNWEQLDPRNGHLLDLARALGIRTSSNAHPFDLLPMRNKSERELASEIALKIGNLKCWASLAASIYQRAETTDREGDGDIEPEDMEVPNWESAAVYGIWNQHAERWLCDAASGRVLSYSSLPEAMAQLMQCRQRQKFIVSVAEIGEDGRPQDFVKSVGPED